MDTIIEVSNEGTESSKNKANKCTEEKCGNGYADDELHENNFKSLTDEVIKEMTFESIESAESFYRQYAEVIGFGVRKSTQMVHPSTKRLCMKLFVCRKQGHRSQKWLEKEDRIREPKSITRTGCKAHIRFRLTGSIWIVCSFVSEHSHGLVPTEQHKFVRSRLKLSDYQVDEACALRATGIRQTNIMRFFAHQAGGLSNVPFTRADLKNRLNSVIRKPASGGQTDAVLTYFLVKTDMDPNFFFEYTTDEEGVLSNMFWADSRSRSDYACFGDVLAFDSTYKKNTFEIPLTVFVGANNHNSSIIFGFALLSSETADSYRWLLITFLKAMHGKMPKAVITDGDRAMAIAIEELFPTARHRLCAWHITQNAKKHIHIPGFLTEFNRCMFAWWTPDRFEDEWAKLIDRYGLKGNRWMAEKYETKLLWAQAYLTGHFFATFKTTARCEGMHSFVKKYVCQYGLPLYEFVRLLDTVIETIRDREAENDYKSEHTRPLLKHPLEGLESHAADVYTRTIFFKFRRELTRECLYIPEAREETENGLLFKLRRYRGTTRDIIAVSYDNDAESIRCSCMRFETCGIPCRHQICVMKMLHLNRIPEDCIMRRWTQNARETAEIWAGCADDEATTNAAQFASFLSQCTRLYYNARKMKDGPSFAKREIAKVAAQVREMCSLRGQYDIHHTTCPRVRDPPTPKMKRKIETADNVVGKSSRKCRVCRQEGHTKRKCPRIELSLGTISIDNIDNMDTDVDTSDEEILQGKDNIDGQESFVPVAYHRVHGETSLTTQYTFISSRDFNISDCTD